MKLLNGFKLIGRGSFAVGLILAVVAVPSLSEANSSPFVSPVEKEVVRKVKFVDRKTYEKIVEEFPDLAKVIKVKKVRKISIRGSLPIFEPVKYLGYTVGKNGLLAVLVSGEKRWFVTEGDVFNGYEVVKVTKDFVLLRRDGKSYKVLRKTNDEKTKNNGFVVNGSGSGEGIEKESAKAFDAPVSQGKRIKEAEE